MLRIQLSIETESLLSKRSEFLVSLVTHLLLLSNESLLVRDLLSKVKVNLIVNTGLLSESSQLS